MDKIKWCAGKKEGLSLIEPNSDLANAYIKKAEEALESMRVNIIKDWKISTAYYTIYFSLYAVLMKLGVKCEIHSCTIEFAKKLYAEKNITVFPGQYLARDTANGNPGLNHVRMALVAPVDECLDAAHRIKQFINSL